MNAVVALLREEKIDLHISASALRTLQECPREWWLKYVEGVAPEHRPARVVLGSALHEALGAFYRALRDGDETPGREELLGIASASIGQVAKVGPRVLFDEGDDVETLIEEADRLLEVFVRDGLREGRVLGVELPFCLPLSEPVTGEHLEFEEQVVGAFDLVLEESDGIVVVVDHKVTSRVDRERCARPDLQMALYAWAAEQVLGVERVELRYQALVRTRSPKVEVRSISRVERDEEEAVEAAAGALDLIHLAVASPNGKRMMSRRRSWRCRECAFGARCEEVTP